MVLMEVLQFAINMELDGEKYYTEQAEINKGNGLNKVFLLLAADENNHAKTLKNRLNDISDTFIVSDTLSVSKNVFSDLKKFKDQYTLIPSQLDAYRSALEKEEQSITLYKKLLAEADNDTDKLLFQSLIKDEESHRSVLDDLVLLLNNVDDWVESAEFNITKEY